MAQQFKEIDRMWNDSKELDFQESNLIFMHLHRILDWSLFNHYIRHINNNGLRRVVFATITRILDDYYFLSPDSGKASLGKGQTLARLRVFSRPRNLQQLRDELFLFRERWRRLFPTLSGRDSADLLTGGDVIKRQLTLSGVFAFFLHIFPRCMNQTFRDRIWRWV